jgi:hypothetical protein
VWALETHVKRAYKPDQKSPQSLDSYLCTVFFSNILRGGLGFTVSYLLTKEGIKERQAMGRKKGEVRIRYVENPRNKSYESLRGLFGLCG